MLGNDQIDEAQEFITEVNEIADDETIATFIESLPAKIESIETYEAEKTKLP